MGYLIILRGPPGVGKTTIARHLTDRLGSDKAVILYLDKMEEFDLNVQEAFGSEYVIGELFFGDSHVAACILAIIDFVPATKRSSLQESSNVYAHTI